MILFLLNVRVFACVSDVFLLMFFVFFLCLLLLVLVFGECPCVWWCLWCFSLDVICLLSSVRAKLV